MAGRIFASLMFLCFLFTAPRAAGEEATLRVVDVGAGLCVVAHAPPGRTMVYDAGNSGTLCADAVHEISNSEIELLVLSHSDADHISDLEKILRENETSNILHPGDRRSGSGIATRRRAIRNHASATVYDLSTSTIRFGHSFPIGDATATFIAGWSDADDIPLFEGDRPLEGAAARNAISIVIRFDYAGHSVLLTGDTIGRHEPRRGVPDDNDALRYAERFMVDHQDNENRWIDADILIGQHHGGDNSSALGFIQAVSPTYVVFSAGSNATYRHPRRSVVERMMEAGVDPDNIYRTDRGDDEGPLEWDDGDRVARCNDPAGDDDVIITLPSAGEIEIAYAVEQTGCVG